MHVRQLTVWISAVALCVVGAVPGASQGAVRGDVNGDGRTDVLDIQAVIGGVLAAQMPDRLTDVNGDGQTDVLDLQLTLRRIGEPAQDQGAPLDDFSLEAPRSSVPIFSLARSAQRRGMLAALPPRHARRAFLETRSRPASCRTDRYLYRLTPHAPPSCA